MIWLLACNGVPDDTDSQESDPQVVDSSVDPPFLADHLVINELVSLGTGGDWVELFNPTSEEIDLSTWEITDDAENDVLAWRLPEDISIAAGGYFLIWCDNGADGLHTDFQLSQGEHITIYSELGLRVDEVEVPSLIVDQAAARIPDGWSTWEAQDPTPEASNE
ncbi:MAG TPA: lamin tail domain-containing protein [Myxococcota bacterium]|nr:lamin tail domain-containing protein [Myxococcota bacterium]